MTLPSIMDLRPAQRAKRSVALSILMAFALSGSLAWAQQGSVTGPAACRDGSGGLQPCPSAQDVQRLRDIVEARQQANQNSSSIQQLSQAINVASSSSASTVLESNPFGSRVQLAPADGAVDAAMAQARAKNDARLAAEAARKSEGLTGEIARHWHDGDWRALAEALLRAGLVLVACVAALGVLIGLATMVYEVATSRSETRAATPGSGPRSSAPPVRSYAMRRIGALLAVGGLASLLYAGLSAINRSSSAPEPSAAKTAAQIVAIPGPPAAANAQPSLRENQPGGAVADTLRRFVHPNRPDIVFAGKGRLIEISVPTDSKATARFQWVHEPGVDIFIDVYALESWAKDSVIGDLLKNPEDIAARLGWLRLPGETIDTWISAIKEGNSYYHLYSAAQHYGPNPVNDYGCSSMLDGVAALVSIRLSGDALQRARPAIVKGYVSDCAGQMSAARQALDSVGVGHVSTMGGA